MSTMADANGNDLGGRDRRGGERDAILLPGPPWKAAGSLTNSRQTRCGSCSIKAIVSEPRRAISI
jgi:hypothetical protein